MSGAVVAWALFGDRSRGRKRCPRCWYDMSAAVGLKCPECGKDAKGERGLLRTRRRWRLVVVGVVMGVVGMSLRVVPVVRAHGWAAILPEWVLVRCLMPVGEEGERSTKLHWASAEMDRRAKREELSGWVVGEAFARQGALKTAEEWPEGWPILVAARTPAWVNGVYFPWDPPLSPEGALVPLAPESVWANQDLFSMMPAGYERTEWVATAGVARGQSSIEIELAGLLSGARNATRLTVRLPMRVTPDAPRGLKGAELDARVGRALRWSVLWRAAPDRGAVVQCDVDWGRVPELDGIIASATLVTGDGERAVGIVRSSAKGPPVLESQRLDLSEDRERNTAGWKVRLEGRMPEGELRWPNVRMWMGRVDLPYDEVVPHELRGAR